MNLTTAKKPLTAARVRELLDYDAASGQLRWKVARPKMPAGTEAGALDNHRHRTVVHIDGKSYLAHRVIWLHVHGRWPIEEIDHINRNPADNRLANLREASRRENARNQRAKRSRSGLKGASWNEKEQCFIAYIRIDGKRLTLGRFATAEEAHDAYCAAATQHHKEFASHA